MLIKNLERVNVISSNSMVQLKRGRKRAVSQIIGSLAMMAIVASVGSVVVFQGLSGIQGFNNLLSGIVATKKDSSSESLMIEHVQFNTTGGTGNICTSTNYCVTLWIRNIGTTDVNIKTIKIMRTDTQMIILDQSNVNLPVYVKNFDKKGYGSLLTLDLNKTYRITITTERGNWFSTMATLYNT